MKLTFKHALGLLLIASMAVSCSQRNKGELTGVPGRKPWYHPQPYGTIYVPAGTFHMGQVEQDIVNSYNAKPKQVSVQAFFMDDTEITNNEYRQFVYWVRDSIVAWKYGQEPYIVTDDAGKQRIDWRATSRLDYEDEDLQNSIQGMFYDEADQIGFVKGWDVNQFKYKYKRFDIEAAAHLPYADRRDSRKRREFITEEEVHVYPDTLVWIRDFAYSYNDPMAQMYFYHPGYDDYPVVGVSWYQATAFCWWRTHFLNSYNNEMGDPELNPFRLPTEAEWEYAARGGRRFSPYPWGGPYTRNSKGCFLMNFKPLRGDYAADGGFYPVKATSYFPNDYGLYNMAGNVAEWTSSAWDRSIYTLQHDMNPNFQFNAKREQEQGEDISPTRTAKVTRGGSWKDVAYFCQVSTRSQEYADTAKSYVGFRCAMTFMGRSIRDRNF